MGPKGLAVAHFVQFCDADTALVGWNMLGHNVHSYFAQIKIGSDTGSGCDAGGFQHIQNDFSGQVPGREPVGGKVVCHIHEDLVDGIDNDVLRGDVLHIHLINAGTVFHIIGHAGRRNDEVNGKGGIGLELGKEMG